MEIDLPWAHIDFDIRLCNQIVLADPLRGFNTARLSADIFDAIEHVLNDFTTSRIVLVAGAAKEERDKQY